MKTPLDEYREALQRAKEQADKYELVCEELEQSRQEVDDLQRELAWERFFRCR